MVECLIVRTAVIFSVKMTNLNIKLVVNNWMLKILNVSFHECFYKYISSYCFMDSSRLRFSDKMPQFLCEVNMILQVGNNNHKHEIAMHIFNIIIIAKLL